MHDPYLRQVRNYVIVDEYMKGYRWRGPARVRLRGLGAYTKEAVGTTLRRLRVGKEPLDVPAVFTGKFVHREGKGKAYKKLYRLVDEFIPNSEDRLYCGLPAHQAVHHHEKLGLSDKRVSMVACDKDPATIEWIEKTAMLVGKSGGIGHYTGDLENLLRYWPKQHWPEELKRPISILDLDLMCCGTLSETQKWSWLARRVIAPTAIVSISMLAARQTTEEMYNATVPDLLHYFLCEGGKRKVLAHERGKYKDSSPMAYEHIVLQQTT